LEQGLHEIDEKEKREIGLSFLTHILISHGHIDHFGGLPNLVSKTSAIVGIHELDLRNLTNTEERLMVISKRLDIFLSEAGVAKKRRNELIQLYKMSKLDYVPVKVDFTYEAVRMEVGPLRIFHVPGHCPGQVVIRLHDILFSGDHILADISPHQAPERLALNTGLGHYLNSLEALRNWSNGIHLTLSGHNKPITDLPTRIGEIHDVHQNRLARILDLLSEPKTIAEVSTALFQDVHGYNVLLALEETGAHVEYLYQRGVLGIQNLAEMLCDDIVPIHYVVI
jgi:glyoxylase-like metal-dependent hydrolase (beta-lactamase superfamily II)